MDEELRVAEAIDRLIAGMAPGAVPGAEEELALARALRGLGEPQWPTDEVGFARRLLPAGWGRRAPRLAAAGAAAAVAAAAIGWWPWSLPPVASLPLAHSTSGSVASSAAPAFHGFSESAPAAKPLKAAAARPAAPQEIAPGAGPSVPAAQWLGPDRVVLAARQVEGAKSPGPAVPAGQGRLVGLDGDVHRIAVQTLPSGTLLSVGSLSPGWYHLEMAPYRGALLFVPYPEGSTRKGQVRQVLQVTLPHRVVTLSGIRYDAQGLWVTVSTDGGAPAPQVVRLLAGGRSEEPAFARAVPGAGSGRWILQYDPVLQGQQHVTLDLTIGSEQAVVEVPLP